MQLHTWIWWTWQSCDINVYIMDKCIDNITKMFFLKIECIWGQGKESDNV